MFSLLLQINCSRMTSFKLSNICSVEIHLFLQNAKKTFKTQGEDLYKDFKTIYAKCQYYCLFLAYLRLFLVVCSWFVC